VFHGTPLGALVRIEGALREEHFGPGDVILREGAVGEAMYLLSEGTVRIEGPQGEGAEESFEAELDAPSMFGEIALLTGEPRTASVVAKGPVRCHALRKTDFHTLLQSTPQAAHFLARLVADRLLESGAIRKVGQYEVLGALGSGAEATVFEGRQLKLDRPVALKMLSHALVHKPGFANRFGREARIIAQLDHEHIVKVYDAFEDWGTQFIVMEKLSGTLLEDIVTDKSRTLAWGAIRRILKEVCLGLAHSHAQGLLHRDVKPSNVFLTQDRRVKILDFGIALEEGDGEQDPNSLVGTPYYMAPERILGKSADGRSDLYSVGIMAYELVTGDVPFHADSFMDLLHLHVRAPVPNPRIKAKDAPPDLVEFIQKATAKKRVDRFSSCAEAADFLEIASELPVVRRMAMRTVAISYHPSREELVDEAIAELEAKLGDQPGVMLVSGGHVPEEG